MKFVCDKCKTRYSIGEDRVRGKILKIRCKNCANVITVREGMDAADDSPATTMDARPRVPTGSQPVAKAPPPPALQPEWYVSQDGQQQGPMSLTEAQRWVASKAHDADLHCWSEGFDDWLPVDKVSHFRGHRQKAPTAPPVRRPPSVPPPLPPKPLFAATMQAIENDAKQSQPKLPAMGSVGGQVAKGTAPVAARANGTPAAVAKLQSAGAAALRDAFQPDPGESLTSPEAPPFSDEVATAAEPAAARRPRANAFDIGGRDVPVPAPVPAPVAQRSVQQALESDDDELSIGEVSRVVKLADLAPKPKPANATQSQRIAATPATASSPRSSGIVPRSTGSQPRINVRTGPHQKLSPSELGMNVDPAIAAMAQPGEHVPDESIVAKSFAEKHRRGMLALIAVSALLVLGVIGAVAFVVSNSGGDDASGLGGTRVIDTSRPEDIVRKQMAQPGTGSGSQVTSSIVRPKWTGTTRPQTNPLVQPETNDPKGMSLKASEVEDMAAKQGEGTKRCYMRAQKGALGFDIADVKKIAVTLTVGKDGIVNDVQLSSHAGDSFGQCLIARIKGWRFRESSSGGTFRISLAFSNS